MKNQFLYILFGIIFFIFPNSHFAQAPNLRSTVSFALFTAAGAFDNVGTSSIKGDIGSKTYTTTGFPPGVISGNIYNASHAQSTNAASDVPLLYNDLTRTPNDVIASSLGGQTLLAGVHSTGSGAAANLNGDITLNGQGNPDALFIIQIDGALIVSGASNVILINSASPNNVFWQINGAISIGISSVFRGTIVSAGAISLLSNATLIGKGLSKAGAIALNTNIVITKLNPAAPTITITQPTCTVATGSISITAPVELGMTYSMDGLDFSNTTGIFSAVPQGTYNVTAKDVDGFISAITIVTINTQPPTPSAPLVGTIVQPTCTIATGSVILNGLPTGNWTINPGAITGTGSTTTINNLLAGTTNYTVTNADGCTSLLSANVL
ncbi:MAG: ice-binding family protein, partial [Sediminibacterium sp.]|nr:ice-binding family protein [Sediminibacterium sp.]